MTTQIQQLIKSRRLILQTQKKTLQPKTIKHIRMPNKVELEYYQYLLHMVQRMRAVTEEVYFPVLKEAVNEAINIKKDSYVDDIIEALAKTQFALNEEYPLASIEANVRDIGNKVSNFNREELQRLARTAVGVDLFIVDNFLETELQNFTEDNISKIKTLQEEYFNSLQDITFRGTRNGESYTSIKNEILQKFRFKPGKKGGEKWKAERIARDQVLSLNAQLNGTRQQNIGFKKYIWRDVNDNRVRSTHAANDGNSFFWSRPPSTGHPGDEILCRCFAEPDFDYFFKQAQNKDFRGEK